LIYHPLGTTGIQVSTIGFGASALGDVFGEITAAAALATVQHAIDSGINFFDVSPYYGKTLAESRLGDALQERRHQVVLATKCGRYGYDDFDFSAATITRELDASLRRLRTDYVDLLQVHDVEFGSIPQIIEETLPAMTLLQQQGKVRMIGITGYWPGLLARMLRQFPVATVLNYCHSNLLMDDMDRELTPVATELGIALINASPLHMGLLAGGDVADWHPAPSPIKHAAARIVALCQEHGVRAPVVALNQCLSHPIVATTLVGFRSAGEIDDALLALEIVPSPELLQQIRAIVEPVRNLAWPSGLPENHPTTPYDNPSTPSASR
jgi:L-galactose dehydrogenase